MKPDGTGLHRLTPDRFPHNDALATYSPQGNHIAFVSDRNYPDECCLDLFAIEPERLRRAPDRHRPLRARHSVALLGYGPAPSLTEHRTRLLLDH